MEGEGRREGAEEDEEGNGGVSGIVRMGGRRGEGKKEEKEGRRERRGGRRLVFEM